MSRSYLFIPGDIPNMLQNLDVFDADSIIIDFEDAVAVHNKTEARMLTHAFLTKYTFDTPDIYIRINDTDTPFFLEDLEAIKELKLSGIVVPKISVDALNKIKEAYASHSLQLAVIGIVETPQAFFDLKAIANDPLIKGLLLGAEDLTKSLGIDRTLEGTEILFARSQLIMAARSYDKEAIDTPYTDVHNESGLYQDTKHAASLGFTGKASIHPNHVETINTLFSPSQKAILDAKRIIKVHKEKNSMRFSLDGKMIDKPIIERAKATLARAKRYGVLQ